MSRNGRTGKLGGALIALALIAACNHQVSTEPHIPRWVAVPAGVELRIVDWRVGETSIHGMAVGQTDLDAQEIQRFYTRRMGARGFEVDASPVLEGGAFAQVFARTRSRDRGLNVTLSGEGNLLVSFSQAR